MTTPAFDAALAFVLSKEGGYVDDPNDRGGETNMGISRRSYPNEDIKGMTRARAAEIYHADYWMPVRGDDLPPAVALAAFDMAVLHGPGRAVRALQQAVGVFQDGAIGPRTLAAVQSKPAEDVLVNYLALRMVMLAADASWRNYAMGWSRRVFSLMGAAARL